MSLNLDLLIADLRRVINIYVKRLRINDTPRRQNRG